VSDTRHDRHTTRLKADQCMHARANSCKKKTNHLSSSICMLEL